MKKLLFTMIGIVVLCSFKPWQTITGNGNIKKESREVNSFTGVAVSGHMDLTIVYGKSNTISVEADDNLLPYIETIIEEGTLRIRAKDNVNLKSNSKITVHVSATQLTDVRLSGSGNINGKGDFTNDGKTSISLSGSGNISLGIKSFNETQLSIAGSGNITLNGAGIKNIDASISGSGNIDCSEIPCDDVKARISGSGNVKVYANKSIEARISGSGNVYYKGSATNLNNKTSGSGKVIKIN